MAEPPFSPQRSGASRRDADAMDLCLPLPVQTAQLIGQQQQLYGLERVAENLGLWLDRLIPVNRGDKEPWGLRAEARQMALSAFCKSYRSSTGSHALTRQREAVKSLHSAEQSRLLRARQQGRLLTDAGRAHTLLSSLSFHPMWGVPRIAGSAIKGAVRSLAAAEGAHLLVDALGTQEKSSQIVFYDALPVDGKFTLALDVVTPHYGDYYTGKAPPTERLSPIPHTFLTVVETTFEFWFAIESDSEHSDRDRKILDEAQQYLEFVLSEWGVGGKTSAGYGRFAIEAGVSQP
jgi:CRISPR-associated protein Cmr6